jgi:hypothetical protein
VVDVEHPTSTVAGREREPRTAIGQRDRGLHSDAGANVDLPIDAVA